MNLLPEAIPVRLRDDRHGGPTVGQKRAYFESVWRLHRPGASPLEFLQAFPTLDVADVCAVLAWALRHPQDLDAYLKTVTTRPHS
jgi:uncharacterized protein (DUF433 family)